MTKKKDVFLLERYCNRGDLNKKYFTTKGFIQPFSAQERLIAGKMLYDDYIQWKKGHLSVCDYEVPRVDCIKAGDVWRMDFSAERFRRSLKSISRQYLPVVYKIVLEEKDIIAPKHFCAREKTYFYNEVRGILCRGLDEVAEYYKEKI